MKIAIISRHDSPNTRDLLGAADKIGAEIKNYALSELAFAVDTILGHEFFLHDVYIFRGYNKNILTAQSLAQLLVWQGKVVVDSELAGGHIHSKFIEALMYRHFKVPHIPTYAAGSVGAWKSLGISLNFPVVIKDVGSSQGKGVRLCNTEDQLLQEIEQHGFGIIIQDYVPIEYDLRVLCIGDEVIGAVKRSSGGGDFRTNVSLGGRSAPYELSEEEKVIAMNAHTAMKRDISGVDLAYDTKGKLFVIETNITPEWQGFTQATGMDVADRILQYVKKERMHG